MAERTDGRTRSRSDPGDFEDLLDDDGPEDRRQSRSRPPSAGAEGTTGETGGRVAGIRDRIGARVGSVFSLRAFLVALVLAVVGLVAVGAVLPFGSLAGLLGVFAASFLYGLGSGRSRYLETLVAGGAAAGVGSLLDYLVLTVAGVGMPLVALGVGAGAVAGLLGHYFGRDLRDGLTRDL